MEITHLTAGNSPQGQSAAKAAVKNLIIYSITNSVNGKKYVGQTRQGLARRKGEHIYRFNLGERNHKLYMAMRKHGAENFKYEALCCCLKPEYLDEIEVQFIEQFNCFNRGYNMTCGGDSVSDETRAKLSAIFKGRKITWYNKMVETRRRNGSFGRPNSKGENSPLSVSYLVRNPDGSKIAIKGLRGFCRKNHLSHNLMLAVLNGKQSHHKGYSLLARFND